MIPAVHAIRGGHASSLRESRRPGEMLTSGKALEQGYDSDALERVLEAVGEGAIEATTLLLPFDVHEGVGAKCRELQLDCGG